MYKMICFSMLMFLLISNITYGYIAGEKVPLMNIEQCDGKVNVKVTSLDDIEDHELYIKGCNSKTKYIWVCKCDGSFDVNMYNDFDTDKTFDVFIEYYLNYSSCIKDINNITCIQNKREQQINNIKVEPEKKSKIPFEFDIKIKNVILASVLIFLLIIGIIVYKGRGMFSTNAKFENDDDVLNYKNLEDKEFDEIFNDIK